jgi:tetratricopeptide (TPR) repeat protein
VGVGGGALSSRVGRLKTLLLSWLVIALCSWAQAQTFKVDPNASQAPEKEQKDTNQKSSSEQSLGWGSNIQSARVARAAEEALKNGQYAAAVDYAQRAAQGAPNDPHLWFLLGYAARLDGKLQLSIDAYNRGLRLSPSSIEGLSGLAQTYGKGGQTDEAEKILNEILAADPKRTSELLILGELFVQTGRYEQAIGVLQRAERIQPSPRSEVLIALSYEHLKQFNQANHYIELAKQHAPHDLDVQRSMAGLYRETGNYSAAIATLKPIAGKNPAVMAELAYTYQLADKKDEAAKLYARAAETSPQKMDLQLAAAQAQVSIGIPEAAERFLKRAAALDSEYYRLHAIRGQIAAMEERDPDAAREYNAALDHLPQAPSEGPLYRIQLRMDLVEIEKRLQDEPSAHRNLEIAQSEISALDERGPERPAFLRLRALVRVTAGDLDGAQLDIKEALDLNAKDPAALQLDGDLLVKLGHPEEAVTVYRKVLAIDPVNRSALTSLGYVSRETGHDQDAEKYFRRLAAAYPKLYVPYLALGDMYTARREFPKAEASYRKGHELAPSNPLIVAGGMNAAIEAHHFPLAADWLKQANGDMQREPHMMRERERYLTWIGEYQQSAEVGREAITKLPKDRDVVVYLGYDLLHLEKYDELLALTSRYDEILPKEPDLPLLAGYVHKHNGQLDQAQVDFTHALDRDPDVVTAYVNRGYVLNDLHKSAAAASDFESAIRREPKNGEAHLGLAFASLDLHRPRVALREVQTAEKELGESISVHLIRATAYGEEGSLTQAVAEYRAALKYSPNDAKLHLAISDALYGLRHYREAINELELAKKLTPDNSIIYAQLARVHAQLHEREETLQCVQIAERQGSSAVFVSTGEALSLIGDRDAAMQRFERALTAPNTDRVAVRLAIAKLMADQGEWDDARRQVALAFMEARSGETLPPTGEQLMQAANLLLTMHEFQLAQTFFQRARAAGAPDTAVRVGLANTYLARGDTPRAQGELASIRGSADSEPSYQYLLAEGNMFLQQHQNTQALTAFAQATNAAGEDDTAQRELLQTAGNEGLRLNRRVSVLSNFSVAPIFEDSTVYVLDSKLDVVKPLPGRQGLLPLPRSSLETQWTGAYHLHLGNLPDASGFFQVRNARGQISLPSVNNIVNRDTTDYSFNFGLNPTLHLGDATLTFNTGLQETIRRDARDPFDMNQNLFRQFVYLSTSSFFNIISINGYAIREAGPFTENHLHSRELTGQLEFKVGAPWGKTALVTGWGASDLQFSPLIREFYYTSAYVGIERKVSDRLNFRVLAEDIRAWRVVDNRWAIAQAIRPAANLAYSPTRNWSVQGSFAYSRGMGFHAYDNVQSGFSISYAKSVKRSFKDGNDEVPLRYPIRFSVGMQQESFYNFNGGNSQQLRPYVSISLF